MFHASTILRMPSISSGVIIAGLNLLYIDGANTLHTLTITHLFLKVSGSCVGDKGSFIFVRRSTNLYKRALWSEFGEEDFPILAILKPSTSYNQSTFFYPFPL